MTLGLIGRFVAAFIGPLHHRWSGHFNVRVSQEREDFLPPREEIQNQLMLSFKD